MSDHGINVTYKAGSGYDDFWITVGADDPNTWAARNDAVCVAIADAAANTAAMIRAANAVAKELPGAVTVSHQQPAAALPPATVSASGVAAPAPGALAPSAPSTPTQVVASEAPAQSAAPASPPQAVAGGELPANVRIWQGPNPEKPQYTELFIDYPYNQAFSNALKAGMEAAGQKLFWNKTAKARVTNPRNESLLRSLVAQNSALLGA